MTVHLLDHTRYSLDKKREPIDSDPKKRFWIDWSKEWRNINDTRSVKGDEAVALHTLLRESLVNSEAQHFCGHDPIYGIVAVDAEGKILKTSLCFTCGTWVRPNERLDIAGPMGIENPLCVALRKIIELPKEVIDAAKVKNDKP